MTEYNSRAFDLIPDGDYMRYEYHHGEVIDYLSADETLFQILTQCGLSPFLDDGRIRFTDSHDNDKYRIGDLAFACYNGHIKSIETWKADMQEFLDCKHREGTEVDHADSNPHNNTVLNLSLMDGDPNAVKSSKVARFKPPTTVVVAYVAGEYRVHVEWSGLNVRLEYRGAHIQGESKVCLNLLCSDDRELASCLDELSILETDWSNPAKIKGTWQHSEKMNPCSNARVSISAQERIADMEREEFDTYTEGQLKEYLKLVRLKAISLVGEVFR